MDDSLTNFMEEYSRRTNTHRFDEVAALIAEDAVFWFSDGSYRGLASIRDAFERTWQAIQDEFYAIDDVEWLVVSDQSAVCIYSFHWRGIVKGVPRNGAGRGTSGRTRTPQR